MAITYPHDFSTKTGIISGTEVQQQFAAIGTKFNANITTADISGTAGITYGQLAPVYQHVVVQAEIIGGVGLAGTSYQNGSVARMAALPNLIDGSWYIDRVAYYCSDPGTAAATFSLHVGWFNTSTGAWTNSYTLNTGSPVSAAYGGTFVPTTTSIIYTTNPLYARVYIDTAGTSVLTSVDDRLLVSLHLYREVHG